MTDNGYTNRSEALLDKKPNCHLLMVKDRTESLVGFTNVVRTNLDTLRSFLAIPPSPPAPADTYEKPGPVEAIYNEVAQVRAMLEDMNGSITLLASKLSCPLEQPVASAYAQVDAASPRRF